MSNLQETILYRNGQKVYCYGEWREDSNASCIFEDEVFDGIWADGATCWTDAVEQVTAYAKRNGTILIEMVAC
jgi:hypothetical protein